MLTSQIKRHLVWIPPIIWMILIFIGSSIPGGQADTLTKQGSGFQEPVQIQRIKDVVHVVEFGILTLLLIRAYLRKNQRFSLQYLLLSFAISTLYGIFDELHQYFVPLRTPGLDDIIRNTVGAGLAAVLSFYYYRHKRV